MVSSANPTLLRRVGLRAAALQAGEPQRWECFSVFTDAQAELNVWRYAKDDFEMFP
jgi:hypothetical protein